MKYRILFSVIILLLTISVNAQNTFKGKITDETGQGLNYATVTLLSPGDSIMKYFGVSNNNGDYQIKSIKSGDYILQASFVGKQVFYRNISLPLKVEKSVSNIIMKDELLGEARVIGEYIPIEFKTDTVEYNTKAFSTKPDAVVEDLLKKIPGVEVDNSGNVKAMGEDVTKVLVDGKEFFGKDPKVATKNLPAKAVEKVQIFDKKSEEAEFMGIDDGVRDRTINILLNEDNKQGYFGDIELGAGYSSQLHYKGDAKVYRFSEKLQIAFLGMYNNVNEFGYSGKGHGWGRTINGVNTTGAGGINLSYNKSKYNRYFVSYLGQSTNTILEQDKITQNILEASSYKEESELNSEETDAPHKINFGIRHNFNKNNNFTLDGDINYSYNDLQSTMDAIRNSDGTIVNQLSNTEKILSNELSADAKGVYILKANDDKTQFKTNILGDYSRNFSDNQFENITTFFNPDSEENINQYQTNNTESLKLSATPTLVQQIKGFWYISANTGLAYNKENLLREQGNLSENNPIDSLGANFGTELRSFKPELSIQRNAAKLQLNFTLGASFDQFDKNVVSTANNLESYQFLLPSVSLTSYYAKGKRFSMKYYTGVNMPSVSQLLPVVNTLNPLSLYEGNLALEPEYKHNFRMHWSIFDQFTFTSLFARIGATYTENKISTSRTVTPEFVNITSPVNTGDHYSANGMVYFSTPVRALGIKLNLRGSETWSRGTNIINNEENLNNSLTHSVNLSIENRKKEKWDLLIGGSVALTNSKYSIAEKLNNVYYNTSYFTQINYNPNDNWNFFVDANMMEYNSKSFGESISIPLVNAGIDYYFSNWKKASLKLEVKDALNKSENIYRISEANYLMQQTSNTIGRLVMLSFKMKLGKI